MSAESVKPYGGQGRKETPRPVDLKEIVAKCVDRYIDLGFHKVVYPGLSEKEAKAKYRKDFTVPKDARQPVKYQGHSDVVVAHEPRITSSEKDRRAGIHAWIDTESITNLTEIPDKPYIAFTHDGIRHFELTVKINQAMERFSDDEVGEPLTETIDVYLNYPGFFEYDGRYAAGSRTESGHVPCLNPFNESGELEIDREELPDYPHRGNGVGSRGKEIIKLGV